MNPAAHGAIPIDFGELAVATALVLVAGLVSLGLGLGLERRLALAALRTVIQLLAIGYVLGWVFGTDHPLAVIALGLVMTAVAARAAVKAPKRSLAGGYSMAFATLVLTGLVSTLTVTRLVIGVHPWYRPQYLIPLLGMVFGNALTGMSLSLDQLLEALGAHGDRVEAELALGASRWEAVREPLADAVRRGMIPMINSMMVVGVVSLPGMMTGQILQGAKPGDAVRYQIVVMFMLSAATSLACIVMALLVYRRVFNERHQLASERIGAPK